MNFISFLKAWGLLVLGVSPFFLVLLEHQLEDVFVVLHEFQNKKNTIEIPHFDALRLELFFKELIMKDGLGYTMIGKKPMSFGGYRDPASLSLFFSPPDIKMALGWKTWEKYRHFFENQGLKFWVEEAAFSSEIKYIVLMDKKCTAEVIEQNGKDFQEVLGAPNTTLSHLLQDFEKQPFIKTVLRNHDALLGILLGYGKGNAWWYHFRAKSEKNPSIWEQEIQPINFSEYLRRHFWPFRKFQINDILLPCFVGIGDSDESIDLKTQYIAARKDLICYYEGKNFLEATLNLYKNGPLPPLEIAKKK